MTSSLPFIEVYSEALKGIHKALYKCHLFNKQFLLEDLSIESIDLSDCFDQVYNIYKLGTNKHLTTGIPLTHRKRYGIYPRLIKLTIQSYKEAQAINKNPNFKGLTLPSPFYILYQALTVPEEPQTSAFAHVLCRSILFYVMELHPENSILNNNEYFDIFDEDSIINSISSFRNYIKIQARWPDQRDKARVPGPASRINFLLGNYLSMKGYAHLWFNNEHVLINSLQNNLESESEIWYKNNYSNPHFRFRIAESYIDLPNQGEIINSLFGIPLPFRGGDILFYGGLRKTSSNGTVINLYGKPGVGKTSIALSLSAILSPFGTETIYISLEEELNDLYKRLLTLIPEYLKELSIYSKPHTIDKPTWFSGFKIGPNEIMDFDDFTKLISLIKKDLDGSAAIENYKSGATIPAVCPLYIVIDNLNELAEGYKENAENYSKIERFIIECRKLGAIVILISSEEVPEKTKLNYLVDISVHAKQVGTDDILVKPIRIFQLNKTRNQISRQGSHVFHLSGSVGFRICPQIPSQMDKKESLKKILPDKSKCISTLNILESSEKAPEYVPYLKIFPNSQILIHGHGSSGKAGLGLKILLTPAVDRIKNFSKVSDHNDNEYIEQQLKNDFSQVKYQRKVLVISFLYSQDYYEELIEDKIITALNRVFKNLRRPKYRLLSFYPGYLTAEDFINKIIRNLDHAILDGEPFTGIILDGLHNVFLQFKNLQDNDMVWPLLYGILARYNVTVISTFTNFRISTQTDLYYSSSIIEDQILMQKGQTPLLHSMVRASDFYISLEEEFDEAGRIKYKIKIRSSVDQTPPPSSLEWDRQTLAILDFTS